jgi:hypothetical protein
MSVREILDVIHKLAEASSVVNKVRHTLCDSSASIAPIDFREFTILSNNIGNISTKFPIFLLASKMSALLFYYHNQASHWSDLAQKLVPAKFTRRKSKSGENKTSKLSDLFDLINSPICRLIKLPVFDDVMQTVQTAKNLSCECLDLFFSSSEKSYENEVSDESDQAGTHSQDSRLVLSFLNQLLSVQSKFELLAVDIEEGKRHTSFLDQLNVNTLVSDFNLSKLSN